MAIVTPSDRPQAFHNRCVIEVFEGGFCVVMLPFGLIYGHGGCRGFCHKTESDLVLFLYMNGYLQFVNMRTFCG